MSKIAREAIQVADEATKLTEKIHEENKFLRDILKLAGKTIVELQEQREEWRREWKLLDDDQVEIIESIRGALGPDAKRFQQDPSAKQNVLNFIQVFHEQTRR